ncbi:MAG: metal-dependent hydrolase [Acidobacteria bacterium RIFCSPLOWO2_02_FULL_65_29]|nr:MAG: metal-dependent hydrolase [Acidobacteria bacterium RIFCSPLOWO2_02_FULL_65_29]
MDRQFPIGKFHRPLVPLEAGARAAHVDEIDRMPASLRSLVAGLTDAQLDTPYRAGGWTVRQVVHHVPESHMNAYVRFKLAVTEDTPLIKTYEEALWAELPDARTAPIGMSLDLLDALHRRWVTFLRALPDAAFQKAYKHPELGVVTLDTALALYAWHGKHHVAHVRLVAGARG